HVPLEHPLINSMSAITATGLTAAWHLFFMPPQWQMRPRQQSSIFSPDPVWCN
ncbi:MAG: hypothetical protein ACI9MB_004692, partial [Verrucomicrobiales bacterium]